MRCLHSCSQSFASRTAAGSKHADSVQVGCRRQPQRQKPHQLSRKRKKTPPMRILRSSWLSSSRSPSSQRRWGPPQLGTSAWHQSLLMHSVARAAQHQEGSNLADPAALHRRTLRWHWTSSASRQPAAWIPARYLSLGPAASYHLLAQLHLLHSRRRRQLASTFL